MDATGWRWLIGTAIAAGGIVAALGGPEEARLKISAEIWGHPPPVIIGVELAPNDAPKGSYIVTLRNPSLEDVIVTGYRAEPHSLGITGDEYGMPGVVNVATATGNGSISVMGADEQTRGSPHGSP